MITRRLHGWSPIDSWKSPALRKRTYREKARWVITQCNKLDMWISKKTPYLQCTIREHLGAVFYWGSLARSNRASWKLCLPLMVETHALQCSSLMNNRFPNRYELVLHYCQVVKLYLCYCRFCYRLWQYNRREDRRDSHGHQPESSSKLLNLEITFFVKSPQLPCLFSSIATWTFLRLMEKYQRRYVAF